MGAFRRNGTADLLLYQRADTLWLDVVMPPNADRPIRVELGKLRPGQPNHVLLCYVANMPNDKLVCYLDGTVTLSEDYDGGFSNWSADRIVFGQDLAGGRSWRGRIMAAFRTSPGSMNQRVLQSATARIPRTPCVGRKPCV
jgi:hypothetical protein